MTKFVPAILGIFTIAGASFALTGCDETEQQSGNGILRAFGVTTSVPPVQSLGALEVVSFAEPEPEPCVILATEFRQWMCSEDGRKILIP